MLIKFKPLLNKLDAKPPTSPVIPPPIVIKQSCLEKFLLSKIFKISLTYLIFLFFSLASKLNLKTFFFFKTLVILFINFLELFYQLPKGID
jgi:hypothetical protein